MCLKIGLGPRRRPSVPVAGCASRMGEETMQGADATSSAPPPRGPNRRATPDRQIRELAARLSQGGVLKPEFEYELLAMFINNELSARITLPLLALIFSLASMFWAPVVEASVWLAAVIAMKFFMIAACRKFLAQPRGDVRVKNWRDMFVWLEFATGIAWGGMAVVGLESTDAISHVFILTSLIV